MSKRFRHITDIAYGLLEDLGITKPSISVDKIAKHLDLNIIDHEFGSEISGALVLENGTATIGVNRNENLERRRFTICHEIGHYLFHRENRQLFVDEKKFQVMFRAQSNRVKQDYKMEKEANHFAASILMPEAMIEESISELSLDEKVHDDETVVEKLAKKYQVSQPAMTYRLLNLGYYEF